MGFFSARCMNSKGKPRMTFLSKDEADREAAHLKATRNMELASFHCRFCELWHLGPQSRSRNEWAKCEHCKGRDGRNKVAYPSREDAQAASVRPTLFKNVTLHMRIYGCPHSDTWHLTST